MKWEITTPPTARPLSSGEIESHLRLDGFSFSVETLYRYLDAATDHACETMGCSLMEQTITATFYAGEDLALPRGPVIEVLSVTDDADTEISYDLERVGNSDRLKLRSACRFPLEVIYTAGYASADEIPASIRLAILCHCAALYENRESLSEKQLHAVPQQLEAFYGRRKRGGLIG